ncbi:hypothetical protein KR093_008560, partial [Drosophila rubida]
KMWKLALLAAATCCLLHVRGDVFEECSNSQEGSFVASWENCQSYVYCDGDDSILGQCDVGEYFDSESGACDVAANVRCFLDELDEPSTVPEDGEEAEEEAEEEEVDAADADAAPVEPEPTPPTMDNPTTVDILNIAPVVKPSCPHSDDPSQCLPHMTDFFPHPDKCSYFYYCIKGFLTLQQCPFFYGWDIERRSCVHLNAAKCYASSR